MLTLLFMLIYLLESDSVASLRLDSEASHSGGASL